MITILLAALAATVSPATSLERCEAVIKSPEGKAYFDEVPNSSVAEMEREQDRRAKAFVLRMDRDLGPSGTELRSTCTGMITMYLMGQIDELVRRPR